MIENALMRPRNREFLFYSIYLLKEEQLLFFVTSPMIKLAYEEGKEVGNILLCK